MQVIENKTLYVVKFPCDQSDCAAEACFPGTLTAEKSDDNARHGHTRQVGSHPRGFSKPGFSKQQILLVIFEAHLDFPSFFIRFVNSHSIVKFSVAYENIVNNFPVSQPAAAYHGNRFSVNMMPCGYSPIKVVRFQIVPLAVLRFSDNFVRCQQFASEFEFVPVAGFGDDAKLRFLRGLHNFLHTEVAVSGKFRLSEAHPLSVALFLQKTDLIPCDVVFRAVGGVILRKPHDKGERNHRVAGNRQYQDIVVSHDVPISGVVRQFLYKLNTFPEFFRFRVIGNDSDSPPAFPRVVRTFEFFGEFKKERHAKQFLRRMLMMFENFIKFSQIIAIFLNEIVKSGF